MCVIKNKCLLAFLIVFTSFLSGFVLAAPAQSQFSQGVDFFKQGEYSDAVKMFSKAEEQGMTLPALYYNLASSYYMLGEYEKSREYFIKVSKYKDMQFLAEYNLGLIAIIQKDKKSAKKWLTSVEKNSKDKKLVVLAKNKHNEIKSGKVSARKTPEWLTEKWRTYLGASMGYDDNVNFAPLGITSERSDSFSEIIASTDYLFSGNRRNGWLGEVYYYNINYKNENIFDQYEYGAGIKKHLQLNRYWHSKYALDMNKINYGGESYQTITKLSAEAKNSLSKNQRLYLRYGFEDIKSDNQLFDYLEGWRQKLRAEYRLYRKQGKSRLYYELELNNRTDLLISAGAAAGQQYSYSPTRHTIRGKHTYVFTRQWHLTGDLAYRASDYPATPNQDRQDNRVKAAIYADFRFAKGFKLRAKIERTNNRSTESIYAYKRTVYILGLTALF